MPYDYPSICVKISVMDTPDHLSMVQGMPIWYEAISGTEYIDVFPKIGPVSIIGCAAAARRFGPKTVAHFTTNGVP